MTFNILPTGMEMCNLFFINLRHASYIFAHAQESLKSSSKHFIHKSFLNEPLISIHGCKEIQ